MTLQRNSASVKALALIAIGLFLISRVTTGTLGFYISQRFSTLTLLAGLGLLLVGVAVGSRKPEGLDPAGEGHDHSHAHVHDVEHSHAHDHDHGQLSKWGLALVLLPVLLGLAVKPQPLGSQAMDNRELGLSLASLGPGNDQRALAPAGERNILDWVSAFQRSNDAAAEFANQAASVTGFVYRSDRLADDTFMVSRFVISCCTADAAPVGLIVRSSEAATLQPDQWVEVAGRFQPGKVGDQAIPILVADRLTPTEPPDQPYLYP